MTTPTPVASMRHTIIFASVFVVLGLAGGYAEHSGTVQNAAPSTPRALQLYGSALLIEWASALYVWRGVRHRVQMKDLVGGRWQRPIDVATDIVIATLMWAIWLGIQMTLPHTDVISRLLPQRAIEMVVWVAVAVSAGFCEELVFRGYFQTQFHALTRSLPAAIALQAVLFGVGHFYEGTWAVVKIMIYGTLFGAVAAWRRSLRPGMLAHAWSDLFGVIVFRS
jgi:membrane protease YdiL (CAAX protease family)